MGQRVVSVIDRVTVFPGAAWVTRLARIAVNARSEVALVGLPPALEDDTVQIAVRGPARAADVRITLEVTGADDAGTVDDTELHQRRRALAGVQAELAQLRRQLDALTSLAAQTRGERDEPVPSWSDALGARLALIELRAAREPAVRAEIARVERALEEARQALAAAELRRSHATSAQLPPGSVRKVAELTVEPETTDGGVGGEVELVVSYLVPGARWAPSYVVRLGAVDLRLELRASIAQATGEDWTGVAVEVSTASPQRWTELPELPSLRIGRAQPPPARAGWRPPPPDIDALFTDWDRTFASRRGPAPTATTFAELEQMEKVTVPANAPMQQAAPPPAPAMSYGGSAIPDMMPMAAPRKSGGVFSAVGGLVAGAAGRLERQGGAEKKKSATRGRARSVPADDDLGGDADLDANVELTVQVDLLAYAHLRMRGPREDGRGKLERLGRTEIWRTDSRAAIAVGQAVARAREIAGKAAPSGHDPAHAMTYAFAFQADARLDVPADGNWHNLALLHRVTKVGVRHVAVPAVATDVFRVASFTNPLDAPLLAGPVDVYDRGELVVTAHLDETAPGGTVELGLGVDPSVKTARNARFREEATGVLRGSLKLVHEVTISVENLGARPVQLEVRERLPRPAANEEDVEVHVDRVAPTWEAWKPDTERGGAPLSGGHRWRLELAAAAKRDLHVDYHVRIANKHELVGGNRREP
ncbi:MAG TPA: DUF4139 domain-containing protein [Kofleriaceae bacterium]|nr:DUF4139 domain-containing protein [Kofleriaceae bacterium]